MVTYGDAGLPFLSLASQFLLKDPALMAEVLVFSALDIAKQGASATSRNGCQRGNSCHTIVHSGITRQGPGATAPKKAKKKEHQP